MNRVPREASQDLPYTRPCFPMFTAIGVLALLLLVGASWMWNRPMETAKPSVAEAEPDASPVAVEQANAPPVTRPTATARARVEAARPRSEFDPVAAGAGSALSEQLIGQLSQLQIAGGKLTPEQGAQIQNNLRQLVAQGPAALPAIGQLLEQNQDLLFGKWTGGLVGPPSLRAGLLDALGQIGGPQAVAISQRVLQTTADPLELSLLARNLEQSEPGQHSDEILTIASNVLNAAAKGVLTNIDVGPLFQVLQSYGGANAATQLEKLAPQWGYYATMALAELPSGQGIPSLAKLAADTSPTGIGNRDFALQMLAQQSAQSPDASAALLDVIRQKPVPDSAWRGIADVLGGLQYQFPHSYPDNEFAPVDGPGLRTYRQQNGNQNFASTTLAADGTAPDLSQRLAIIDQLVSAAAGNQAALDALNQARAKLSGGPAK